MSYEETTDEHDAQLLSTRQIYVFEEGHPGRQTTGHRYRMIARWPKYAAKLLPDVEQLAYTYEIDHEERNVKREEYAQGVLLMFHPFRKLEGITRSILRLRSTFQLHTDVRRRTHPTADILDSGTTWWESYIARHDLHSDPDTASTLKSMQNFYESFCPSQNVTELLETKYTDVEHVLREDRATDSMLTSINFRS